MLNLQTGKCSVYESRPAVCQIFGASENQWLTCPHVIPEKRLSVATTDALVYRIAELGKGMVAAS